MGLVIVGTPSSHWPYGVPWWQQVWQVPHGSERGARSWTHANRIGDSEEDTLIGAHQVLPMTLSQSNCQVATLGVILNSNSLWCCLSLYPIGLNFECHALCSYATCALIHLLLGVKA